MAEVLITLGIIGVVAALTMPSLIQNHQKHVVETKVKKFYSLINQALQTNVALNGDVESWIPTPKYYTYEENLDFLQKYFLPYIKYTKFDNCSARYACIYLADGGMFAFSYDTMGGDFYYFINSKFENNHKNCFAFQFNKKNGTDSEGNYIERENHSKTIIEPYAYQWDGNYESLINSPTRGCNKDAEATHGTFCTKLLQMNNWEITKDYNW